ncbi:MAG: hypothetical protein IPH12_18850 [Saprospirales bacterium]|nr:hypothetical protein [Saprospirales bacterium]MBK8919984.1 hypothetical protein [Saprospirales bacterium]
MIKDIPVLKVEDLAVAIAPRQIHEEDHEFFWDTYLLNLKEYPIFSVLVNSNGYGMIDGEQRRTTTLRYFWEKIEPRSVVKVEPVQKSVLGLANEYWISFSFKNYLYDKKYVFVPGSLDAMYFTEIPLLQRKGVMIR